MLSSNKANYLAVNKIPHTLHDTKTEKLYNYLEHKVISNI